MCVCVELVHCGTFAGCLHESLLTPLQLLAQAMAAGAFVLHIRHAHHCTDSCLDRHHRRQLCSHARHMLVVLAEKANASDSPDAAH